MRDAENPETVEEAGSGVFAIDLPHYDYRALLVETR